MFNSQYIQCLYICKQYLPGRSVSCCWMALVVCAITADSLLVGTPISWMASVITATAPNKTYKTIRYPQYYL